MSKALRVGIGRGFLCLSIFLVMITGYIFTFPEFGQVVIKLDPKWKLIIFGPVALLTLGVSVLAGLVKYDQERYSGKMKNQKILFDAIGGYLRNLYVKLLRWITGHIDI